MFDGDELAINVWKSKYASEGEEHYDEMHSRMAKPFAEIDLEYQEKEKNAKKDNLSLYGQNRKPLTEETIYNYFKDFGYIVPQGSIMSTLGTKTIASLSNCWVAESPYDSYGGILKTDSHLAYYYKRRGGVGTDISNLRPKSTKTNNTAKATTGAVSFMHRFSSTTREVAMEGRRGALMLSISVNHPDVMDFIKVKRDGTSVTGANISVKLNNKFMEAVENDEDYILRWPCEFNLNELVAKNIEEISEQPYNELKEIGTGLYVKRIKAKEYWNEIVKSAKNHAEPGLMYWDNVLDNDPAAIYSQFKPTCSNPCGEQFLNPNDSCRLMALNLYGFVDNPFMLNSRINEQKLYEISYEHCRMGDNLIDLELEYIQKIINKIKSDPEPKKIKRGELDLWKASYKNTKAGRRIGLGITALGDMLAALGLKYDSDEALSVIKEVMAIKMRAELDCSIDLAILRGTFDGWDPNKEYTEGANQTYVGNNKFYQMLLSEFPEQAKRMYEFGRRNVSWSTIAPTGSVSLLTQTTSGCEPLFLPFHIRRKKINPNEEGIRIDFRDEIGDCWQEFPVFHPKFKLWLETKVSDVSTLTQEGIQKLFEESPWYGATANDINWVRRNEIQAILQNYTTNAISSTINLPSTVTEQEVSEIYLSGWKLGLKGQTVYVDGSRSGVLISKKEELVTFGENHAPKRPKKLSAKVIRFNNNYEKWVAFVGLIDNKPYEIFTGVLDDNIQLPSNIEKGSLIKVKSDGEKRYDFVFDGGVVKGVGKINKKDLYNYGKLISGILRHGMPLLSVIDTIQSLDWDQEHINTWKNGVARALKKFIKDGTVEGAKCKDCGSDKIIFQEGCQSCKDCGSSKCG